MALTLRQRQGRYREGRSEGRPRQIRDWRNTNRLSAGGRSDAGAIYPEGQVIQGQSRKTGKGAEKVDLLNWGSWLAGGTRGTPQGKMGGREEASAEGLVSRVVGHHGEGQNGK